MGCLGFLSSGPARMSCLPHFHLTGQAGPRSQQVDLVEVAGQDRVPHVLEDFADVLGVSGACVVTEEASGTRALPAPVSAVHTAGVHAGVHVQDEPLGCLRVLLRA